MKSRKTTSYLSILILSIITFFGYGTSLDLQAEVTGVTVSVSQSDFTGKCPKLLTFTGRITVNMEGSHELRYRWVRSDGATLGIKGGVIGRSGVIVRTMTWKLGATGKSYRNYWMALEILPDSYHIDTRYNRVTPLMTSNRALFTLKCVNTLATPRNTNLLVDKNIRLPLALPQWEISGRISSKPELGCRSCLQGRKIKIILRKGRRFRKGSRVTRHVFTLNRNSSYNYRFRSPFITAGTYTITVVKGPPDQANYGNDLNICFNGVAPVSRTVTLTSSNKRALNQDFQIDFSLIWGGGRPLCW